MTTSRNDQTKRAVDISAAIATETSGDRSQSSSLGTATTTSLGLPAAYISLTEYHGARARRRQGLTCRHDKGADCRVSTSRSRSHQLPGGPAAATSRPRLRTCRVCCFGSSERLACRPSFNRPATRSSRSIKHQRTCSVSRHSTRHPSC